MKPCDLLKKEPVEVTKDLYVLLNPWHNHIEEINVEELDINKNEHIELKIYYDPYIDGERCCTIGAAYFNNKPVMIFRYGGRGGHDEYDEFVLDGVQYRMMIQYLHSLSKVEKKPLPTYSLYRDIPDLDTFYGYEFKNE